MEVKDLQRETMLLQMIAERNQIILNQSNMISALEEKLKELENGDKAKIQPEG